MQLGNQKLFNISPVATGQTDCAVTEQDGALFITLTKAARVGARNNAKPKVLVQNCKITVNGY